MNLSKSRLFVHLFWAAFLVIIQGCGQATSISESTPEKTAASDSVEIPATDEMGDIDESSLEDQIGQDGREGMVFVVDPDYNPIPNAVIGIDNKYADMSGVFYGAVAANEAGWVPVQAPGYVTNYAKPSPFSGEYDLYFVTLAPVETTSYYQNAASSALKIGDPETPRLGLSLEPGALDGETGYLELTEIDPRKISMDDAWAELDNPYGHLLSIDISAWNLDGEKINLEDGKTAAVTFRDADHDAESLILKSFDPESGTWVQQKDVCSRVDEETIQCSLNHFSMHTFLEDNLDAWQLETEAIDDFRVIFYTIGAIYKEGEKDGTLTDEAAEAVSNLFEKLVETVKDFAKRNPNETGKAMLVYTAQLAQASGIEGGEAIANDLIKQAQDLTAEMAKKLIEKADCGHTDEIMHLIEQGQRLGGSAATAANDLVNKVKDQMKNCVIWKGEIHYMFFLLNDIPELEGHWNLQNPGLVWHEIHAITIGINPVTGQLSGTSKIRNTMNEASYLAIIGSGDCGPDKHYLDIEGKPGVGFTTLSFEGTYKDQIWSIGPLQEKDAEPAMLFMHQHGLFGCPKQVMELSNTQMFTYKSQLLHGLMGTPQPPSLEEMLNGGVYRKHADGNEIIRGYEDIYYSSGISRPPIMPIDHAHVNWRFIRVSDITTNP